MFRIVVGTKVVFESEKASETVDMAVSLVGNGKHLLVKELRGSRWFTILEGTNLILRSKGKLKDYYHLPVDQYGHPTGTIVTVPLYRDEYLVHKENGYWFEDYISAVYRAMD